MVDVGVGQQNEIQGLGAVEPVFVPVAQFDVAVALMHAAVDGEAGPAAFQHIARAGHGPGGSEKGNLHSWLLEG